MAETKFVMGALPGKKDIRDYKIKKKVCMAVTYPETYECPNIVKVKNQGPVGSCVAHATSQILEFHEGGTANDFPKLSTNFIYGIHYKLFGSKGPGMYLRESANIVAKYGDPREDLCRGNNEVEGVYTIAEKAFNNPEVMESAAKHRISSYARVASPTDIKYALMTYGPILAAIT